MNKYISIIVVTLVIVSGVWFLKISKNEPSPLQDSYSIENENSNSIVTEEKEEPINNLNDTKKMTQATLNTNKGDITIEFYETDAPNTVANFIKLAKSGFYDGTKFHRVIKGFMIQGGDPLTKEDSKMAMWGTGGPGYKFPDEIDPNSSLYTETGYKKGIVAMANSGPNTNGSQFFIMHVDYPLPPAYTIFGRVVSGQEVVDAIANVKTTNNDRPVDPVVINNIEVNVK